MRVSIEAAPSYETILYTAENMRDIDREEVFATRWTEDPEHLAAELSNVNGYCWSASLDGVPAGVWGAIPVWPHVWVAFAWGTKRWRRVVPTVTKHIEAFMIPGLARANAHRVSAASHERHVEAHRWLESLGAWREPVEGHPNYGKAGERFFTFVWHPPTTLERIAELRNARRVQQTENRQQRPEVSAAAG